MYPVITFTINLSNGNLNAPARFHLTLADGVNRSQIMINQRLRGERRRGGQVVRGAPYGEHRFEDWTPEAIVFWDGAAWGRPGIGSWGTTAGASWLSRRDIATWNDAPGFASVRAEDYPLYLGSICDYQCQGECIDRRHPFFDFETYITWTSSSGNRQQVAYLYWGTLINYQRPGDGATIHHIWGTRGLNAATSRNPPTPGYFNHTNTSLGLRNPTPCLRSR